MTNPVLVLFKTRVIEYFKINGKEITNLYGLEFTPEDLESLRDVDIKSVMQFLCIQLADVSSRFAILESFINPHKIGHGPDGDEDPNNSDNKVDEDLPF